MPRSTLLRISVLRSAGIATLGIGALAAMALVQSGSNLLASHAKGLSEAKSLSVSYVSQKIGGAGRPLSVALEKPDRARLESPEKLVVADGKKITTLDKGEQIYYSVDQTPAELAKLFAEEDFALWGSFYSLPVPNPVKSKALGTKLRKGESMNAVEIIPDRSGKTTLTYYLSSQDGIARVLQIERRRDKELTTTMLDTKSLELNQAVLSQKFAFQAPGNAKQISIEELLASKWLTDLEDAKAMAEKLNRPILAIFVSSSSPLSAELEAKVLSSERFKTYAARRVVLLRVDVDRQSALATRFGIEALPTQMILSKNGTPTATMVGYADPDTFFDFLFSAVRR